MLRNFQKKDLYYLNFFWDAANYLTAGQIYLKSNPLIEEPFTQDDIKSRLLGHWGTSPGLNLIYLHLNRLIQDTKQQTLYVTGPGHGGPALRACIYLEGTMSDVYPEISQDKKGLEILMRDFSWPGGVPSHVSPPTPGSMHEGGELGYSLSHAFGAVLDNPQLLVACVVGDGEAETGPLATAWHSNKFLHPKRDGTVLPILHLNGYKISGPTIFGRMTEKELKEFFEGVDYDPIFVEGSNPNLVHEKMWKALNRAYRKIKAIKSKSYSKKEVGIPKWPAIILRTPKGWTGPKIVDGKKVEGTFRAHQVPLSKVKENPKHFEILRSWFKKYKPQECFDVKGKPHLDLQYYVPSKKLQMSRIPYANGGLVRKDLKLPNFKSYRINVQKPGETLGEATRELGKFLRDVMKQNQKEKNFRVFCPDETNSNRLNHLFDVTQRMHLGKILPSDDALSPTGRVMEVLSEHQCQGWLEGYLLTGRHGFFPCYEAFALIVDSMLNQHGKWLKATKEIAWRKPISSLNYLLTSHAWRQDHNGYSHQGPGFISSVLQKKGDIARIYLPPDANCLLSVANHCLKSKHYINLIIAGKQPMPQWLNMAAAIEHCIKGASIWEWASTSSKSVDLVLACAGDTPTLEIMAANNLLQDHFPELKIQVVNIVDLFRLVSKDRHPHGLGDREFNHLFPENTPVIFAFHGYPHVIHELIYKRVRNRDFHVHGYIEEGTTTTPFDMVVCNKMSRFHLALNALSRLPKLGEKRKKFESWCNERLRYHKEYIHKHGEDIPEVKDWKWTEK
jgi:xylulose-5-phosphate/fructose-6-phosphate phosphoketolase